MSRGLLNKWIRLHAAALLATATPLTPAVATPATPAPAKVGVTFPFLTVEAENCQTTGEILGRVEYRQPAMYASGRKCVRLTANQSVAFTSPLDANTIVIRFSAPVPNARRNGSLSLYVNGTFRQQIHIVSTHIEGANPPVPAVPDTDKSRSSIIEYYSGLEKAQKTGMIFDEVDAFIKGGVKRGDRLELRCDPDDNFDWIIVDCVDLELVPPPLPQPQGSLSVTEFGARPDDDRDDRAAISKCISIAASQRRAVWIPPGRFLLSDTIELDTGTSICGAGIWYCTLYMTASNVADRLKSQAFHVRGNNISVSNLRIDSAQWCRWRSGFAFRGGGNNLTVSNVWVTHTEGGAWLMGNFRGALFANSRIRSTYADGINFREGYSDVVISNNHIRGVGDNGIAIRSKTSDTRGRPCAMQQRVRILHNTVLCPYTAHCITLWGGRDHLIENNFLADPSTSGCLQIGVFDYDTEYPLLDAVIRNNILLRGFGWAFGRPHANCE
ncbi:MAG: right-handed parallel beta-helix repeat-containing protein, partial [Verrucomicrobiae bacterium]|nr:right-handed parallel beta-helix repeat-containing protein [Verrucomicrobiae bacterium]